MNLITLLLILLIVLSIVCLIKKLIKVLIIVIIVSTLVGGNGIFATYIKHSIESAPTTVQGISELPNYLKKYVTITKNGSEYKVNIDMFLFKKTLKIVEDA